MNGNEKSTNQRWARRIEVALLVCGSRFWRFGKQHESKASSARVLRFRASPPLAHLHRRPLAAKIRRSSSRH